MDKQKGFTLMEVLVSLMLVTTVALILVEQQWKTKELISQLIWHVRGAQFLDQIEESLYFGEDSLPPPPPNYHFEMKRSQKNTTLKIDWFKNYHSIIRSYDLFVR